MPRVRWSYLHLAVLTLVVLAFPSRASAQVGSIAGVVRDASDSVIPGVTGEGSSPALIERVRSTVTDSNGRYQINALSVGTYTVTFTLSGFSTIKQEGIVLTSDFTATLSAKMS